jgi:hypothetical protein
MAAYPVAADGNLCPGLGENPTLATGATSGSSGAVFCGFQAKQRAKLTLR